MSFTNKEMNYARKEEKEMKSQFQGRGWGGRGEEKDHVSRWREFLLSSPLLPAQQQPRSPGGSGGGCGNQRAAERSLSQGIYSALYRVCIAMVPRHFNYTPARLPRDRWDETLFTCPLLLVWLRMFNQQSEGMSQDTQGRLGLRPR